MKSNIFEEYQSVNCEACGAEHMRKDLVTVKLSGFNSIISICKSCDGKNPEEQYKDAASVIQTIASIANGESSAEERLEKIKELLEK